MIATANLGLSRCRPAYALMLAAAWLVFALHLPAAAREKIISFDSEIWIQQNGSLRVRETITVEAEGDQIKRGIYRDFPTIYTSARGVRTTTTFDVQSVRRDGQPENFFTENQSNGVRLYIGKKEVFLTPGRYVYEITYNTDRQLGHFDGFDELYWNVTGNGWAFEIDRVTAKVHLPEGASVLEHAGYTGQFGEQGKDFTFSPTSATQVWFETNRILGPTEGLTIAVSWPPGFVTRPTASEQALKDFREYAVEYVGGGGFVLLLLYYLIVWFMVGRDLDGGSIYPHYEPPKGVSPAASRFVKHMGFDNKVFTAAVVNLAVKGYLTIRKGGDDVYTLSETGEKGISFSPGERTMAAKLFSGKSGKIKLKQSNHEKIGKAQKALKTSLKADYESKYFVKNLGYFIPGIVLSVVVVLIMVAFAPEPIPAVFMGVWLSFWSLGVGAMLSKVKAAWGAVIAEGGVAMILAALFLSAFSLPFIGGWFFGAAMIADIVSIGGAVIILLVIVLNVVFYTLLKAPTLLGRQLLDQLEGFELFMSVAEKDRMNLLNPPERTPELFERFLPFALALGVEQAWAENFAGVLGRIQAPGSRRSRGYSPSWYSGSDFDNDIGGMTNSLSNSLSNAISSASTAPGSSSGSGGGGSSGGGGGGGGGGGW